MHRIFRAVVVCSLLRRVRSVLTSDDTCRGRDDFRPSGTCTRQQHQRGHNDQEGSAHRKIPGALNTVHSQEQSSSYSSRYRDFRINRPQARWRRRTEFPRPPHLHPTSEGNRLLENLTETMSFSQNRLLIQFSEQRACNFCRRDCKAIPEESWVAKEGGIGRRGRSRVERCHKISCAPNYVAILVNQ